MEKFFDLKNKNTNIKTEFIAGLITFCAMVYILMVNPIMYTNPLGNGENILGVSFGAIYISTALSAVVGCFLMGLIAKLPIALASGMGLNAFFVYTVCIAFGFSYENALSIILLEGTLFLILSVTGGLKLIYEAIPACIRFAISGGIGLFLALLGLQNAKIVIPNAITGLSLNSFNLLNHSFVDILQPLIGIIGLLVIAILTKKNVKGSILWGVVVGVILYYILGLFVPDFYNNIQISTLNPLVSFKQFYVECLGRVFVSGFDFSKYIELHGLSNFILVFTTTTLTFCLINIFDNIGSLQAACEHGNLLDENGNIPNINKAMTANSLTAAIGATLGTSTVTTYVESTTGIMEGGRTGLTPIFTGLFFILAMFLSPIAQLVPGCATASALIYVGVLMISSVKNIEWDKIECCAPAFLTICMMPFTCNISNGIVFGLLTYTAINVFIGNFKQIKPATWFIVLFFLGALLFSR